MNNSNSLAIFGLDMVTIHSASGKRFPANEDDWLWHIQTIPNTLRYLAEEGWVIAIMSDISLRESKTENIRSIQEPEDIWPLFRSMFDSLGFETFIILDTEKGSAQMEMFEALKCMTGIHEASPESFFVGIRDGTGVHTGDASEKDFATKAGLNFYNTSDFFTYPIIEPKDGQTLAILVGQQASGKSSFASNLSEEMGYVVLSSERTPSEIASRSPSRKFKRSEELVKEASSLLAAGNSVIVDATNPTKKTRAELIQVAQGLGVPVVIYWLSTPGWKYNTAREPEMQIKEAALGSYSKRFEKPDASEGAEVVRAN